MVMPSSKYTDCIPPDEAVRHDLEGKLLCSGSPRCSDLALQSLCLRRCADRFWGEFGSTGIGSCLQPAWAPWGIGGGTVLPGHG